MQFDKPFFSYSQQINLLQSRGLIIKNYEFAEYALSTLSYYDLINRYKRYFMVDAHHFIDDVSIEYLYNFALFDRDIQFFIMKYSVLVEAIFKTKFSYTLAEHCGVDIKDYLKKYYYKPTNSANISFADVKYRITRWINSNAIKNPTRYYKRHHNHIPPWILFKNISLGNVINLYDLLHSDLKCKFVSRLIQNSLPMDQQVDLVLRMMNTVRTFRNCVAHNLNFTELRTEPLYCPSPKVLSTLLGSPLLVSKNKRVPAEDKKALLGVYGAMLSMIVLLDSAHLKATFAQDFLLLLKKESIRNQMYEDYAKITEMPADIKNRFTQFYNELMYVKT